MRWARLEYDRKWWQDLILYFISLQRIGEQHPFESNVVDFEQVWGELYRE